MNGKRAKALRRAAKQQATTDSSLLLPRWFIAGVDRAGKIVRHGLFFTARYPDGHWRRVYQQLKKERSV